MRVTKNTKHLFEKMAFIACLLLSYSTMALSETCLMCATNYKSACAYQGGAAAQIPEGATVCGFATPQDACASLGKTYKISSLGDGYCSGSQYNRLWVLLNNTPTINGPKNNGGGDGDDDGCGNGNSPSPRKGNPIHIGTGNKYQMESVYQGGGEWGLNLSFHYNSLLPSTSSLGDQWQTNFARKVSLINANTVNVTRADAKIYPFKKVATAWQGDADVSERLIEQKNTSGALTGWQYHTLRDEIEQYDSQGKLLSITTRAGKTTGLTYDTGNRLTQIQSPSGKTLTFSYDATNRISQITNPLGELITLSYDNNNNLASITWPDNTTRQFLYENTTYIHALTGIVAENGQRYATYTYSATSGRATGSEHAGGADKIAVAYNNDGVRTRVIDALGAERIYNMTVTNGKSRIAFANQTCANCGG